jgi:hypothetical protein
MKGHEWRIVLKFFTYMKRIDSHAFWVLNGRPMLVGKASSYVRTLKGFLYYLYFFYSTSTIIS